MPFEGPFKNIPSDEKAKLEPKEKEAVVEEKPRLRGFNALRAGLDPRSGEPKNPGWSALSTQQEEFRDPYAAVRNYLRTLPEGSAERSDLERYLATIDAREVFEGVMEDVRIRVEDRLRQRGLLQ